MPSMPSADATDVEGVIHYQVMPTSDPQISAGAWCGT